MGIRGAGRGGGGDYRNSKRPRLYFETTKHNRCIELCKRYDKLDRGGQESVYAPSYEKLLELLCTE